MTFRDREKKRYESTRHHFFGPEASAYGTYRGLARSFCLPNDSSHENLYKAIREEAITYFNRRAIPWHDGLDGRRLPSNHLCCSQSCCINFLFPLSSRPGLLRRVLMHIYPDIKDVLPLEGDRRAVEDQPLYIAFEWIGLKDYLGEHAGRRGARTRGANYTSADFAFRFRQKDGKTHLVVGEWKYTENAGSADYGTAISPTDRKPERRIATYLPAFTRPDGFFKGYDQGLYHALFIGACYQWLRLELLAQEMETWKEMNADVVSVLWICPEANDEFRHKATIPTYLKHRYPDASIFEIWRELAGNRRFREISTERFRDILIEEAGTEGPEMEEWTTYLTSRYGW